MTIAQMFLLFVIMINLNQSRSRSFSQNNERKLLMDEAKEAQKELIERALEEAHKSYDAVTNIILVHAFLINVTQRIK